jgi:hypothetical protein
LYRLLDLVEVVLHRSKRCSTPGQALLLCDADAEVLPVGKHFGSDCPARRGKRAGIEARSSVFFRLFLAGSSSPLPDMEATAL